jgi:ABC-2 type transport system ATP-binding protein
MIRPVRSLSSGMKQKLGLVAALQHRPDLIILDEPANRLDPLVHRSFCELLRSQAADGRTILLSSHVLGEVEDVCDRIALIKAGRLIRSSSVEAVRAEAQRRVTLRYDRPHPPPAVLADAQVTGDVVTGRIPAAHPEVVRQLVADPSLRDIEIEPASLEDVVLEMYVEGAHDAGNRQG